MRTIKFRIWDELAECFIKNAYNKPIKVIEDGVGTINFPSYWAFQQFTGCKDSKGTDIYEGDIMASRGNYVTDDLDENGNYKDLTNVVVWNTHWSRFGLIPLKDLSKYSDDNQYGLWTCSITTFKEVVGNIYEKRN